MSVTATETKSEKSGVLHFYILGEGVTQIARESWVSLTPRHAYKFLMDGIIGMEHDWAMQILTGKLKMIGDSRIKEGDGILNIAEDNTTDLFGINISAENITEMLERHFLEKANYRLDIKKNIASYSRRLDANGAAYRNGDYRNGFDFT